LPHVLPAFVTLSLCLLIQIFFKIKMQLSINLGYKGCKWTENKSKDKNKKLRKTNAPIHNEYIRK
jgi:hypothetical protein